MTILIAIVLVVASASLVMTTAFIAHELGWFPHGKDRTSAADRKFGFQSLYAKDVRQTHDWQVLDPLTDILRRAAHPEIYDVKDPVQSLENVIARYREQQSMSRYDDLVHLSNYVCNHVKCDDKINELISEVHDLMHSMPPRSPGEATHV